MTKDDREIFQRNLMVAIQLITYAYSFTDHVKNLKRAQELLREALALTEV